MNRSLLLWFQLLWKVTVYPRLSLRYQNKRGTLGVGNFPEQGTTKTPIHEWHPERESLATLLNLIETKKPYKNHIWQTSFSLQKLWSDEIERLILWNFLTFCRASHKNRLPKWPLKRPWSNFALRFYAFYLWSSWSFWNILPWEWWWKHGSLPRFSSPQQKSFQPNNEKIPGGTSSPLRPETFCPSVSMALCIWPKRCRRSEKGARSSSASWKNVPWTQKQPMDKMTVFNFPKIWVITYNP